MKFFVDTADTNEIKELAAAGLLDGVTTNPSLVAKANRELRSILVETREVVQGPVSVEAVATDHETMLSEGRALSKIARHIAVKVPRPKTALKPVGCSIPRVRLSMSPFASPRRC
jgi:transaldolase